MEAPATHSEFTYSIDDLLEKVVERRGSDLHVTVGTEPVIRVHGHLERLEEYPKVRPDDAQRMLYRIMSTEQQKHFETKRQIDLSYSIPGLARFRVNIYFQRESVGGAFRTIPTELDRFEREFTRSSEPRIGAFGRYRA